MSIYATLLREVSVLEPAFCAIVLEQVDRRMSENVSSVNDKRILGSFSEVVISVFENVIISVIAVIIITFQTAPK